MRTISLPASSVDNAEEFLTALLAILQDLIRRSVDGTVPPLFVDYNNQRVIIGATAVSPSPTGLLEVNGDAKIVGSANGILLPDSGGTGKYCRVQALYDAPSGNFILTSNPQS